MRRRPAAFGLLLSALLARVCPVTGADAPPPRWTVEFQRGAVEYRSAHGTSFTSSCGTAGAPAATR